MKFFLRYQLTGSVFIIWIILFYLAGTHSNFNDIFNKIISFKNENVFLSVFAAYPIGVLIHQISVLIKNCFLIHCFPALSDTPFLLKKRKQNNLDLAKFYFDKISNLNTFFYVRFDNGFLSPFLAFIFSLCVFDRVEFSFFTFISIFSFILSILILVYIFKIVEELKIYEDELKSIKWIRNKRNFS